MEQYEAVAHQLGIANIVRFTGRVSPDQARDRASLADVLLVIDAPSGAEPSMFLPSKLIDYLPLRRPILAITPRRGPVADVISELGYVAVEPDDRDGLVTALTALADAHEGGTLAISASHDAVSRAYDIRETTAAFEGVLELARQSG
jgi:glycosyltransferase involved in cell wall biosynthesis